MIRILRQAVAGLLTAAGLAAPGLTAAALAATASTAPGPARAAVDVNTATPEQLDGIRGIGPALSARIVQERAKRPFRDMADLQQRVRGIGPATARKLAADGLTVGGSTTYSAPGPAVTGATGGAAGASRPGAPASHRAVAGSPASGPVVDTAPAVTPIGQGRLIERRDGPRRDPASSGR